jgi:xylan 1,4-beta-xylosidase
MELTLDLAETAVQFRHSYEECVSSCRAALALRSDWQAQLRKCHHELGFRHVRLPGLLNDEMSVCVGGPGWLEHRFHNVDTLYDFLLGVGVRPLVQLSYMPTVLASGEQTVHHYRANVTPPGQFDHWENLVRELTRHLAGRYGRDEVARWPFEVWNEPNQPDLWAGTQEQYFELYRRSAAAVKSVNPACPIGEHLAAQMREAVARLSVLPASR